MSGQGVRWHPKKGPSRRVHLLGREDQRIAGLQRSRCGKLDIPMVDRLDQGVTCRMCRWCARMDAGGKYGG